MPELPEVEAIVQTLRPLLAGQIIQRCRVIHAIAVAGPAKSSKKSAAQAFSRRVEHKAIRRIERRGKFVLMELDEGCIAAHFRLDGKFVWADGERMNGHMDVEFRLGAGTLGYVDPRHLGRVQWAACAEDIPGIAMLGPDPLAGDFTARVLRERLEASKRPLKIALMDPARIAGLGNIYSSESLWRAQIDPRRSAGSLTTQELRRLHKSIVEVLRRALECCIAPAPDLRNPNWWYAGLENLLRVYEREGETCARCGAKIRRLQQGGRSTFACLRCQT